MATETTYRVHGGLHHNGQFYKHGSVVPASLFGKNEHVDDELAALKAAGTLKTEAEFLPPEALQSTLDEKDAEIARLREELEKRKSEREEAQEKTRIEGPAEGADAEQFPKSDL